LQDVFTKMEAYAKISCGDGNILILDELKN
jgi:hypothetical protein